jgi:hypothetical protein
MSATAVGLFILKYWKVILVTLGFICKAAVTLADKPGPERKQWVLDQLNPVLLSFGSPFTADQISEFVEGWYRLAKAMKWIPTKPQPEALP